MATKKTASTEEAKKSTTKTTSTTKKAPAKKKSVGSNVVKKAVDKIDDSVKKDNTINSDNVFDKFEDQEKVTLYKEKVDTVQGLFNIFGNPDATMEVPKAAVEMYNEGQKGGKITLMNINIDKDNITAKVGDKTNTIDTLSVVTKNK